MEYGVHFWKEWRDRVCQLGVHPMLQLTKILLQVDFYTQTVRNPREWVLGDHELEQYEDYLMRINILPLSMLDVESVQVARST